MVLIYEFGLFQVELYNDEIYSRDSADNKYKYDFYYFNSLDEDSLSSKCAVRVLKDEKVYRSAILIAGGGGKTSVHQNAALIDGQNLIDILGDSIFSLNLPDLGLNWCLKCEDSVCLGLYQIPNGYLIHGEQSITKVNQKGKIDWQLYGRDIFVTPEGLDNFVIKGDRIEVKDWDYNIYYIDFSGKEIK